MLLLNRVKRDDRVFAAWSSRGLIWCIHKNSNVKINARLFETIDGALSRSNLGVTITSDLNWNKHINQTEGKANQTLGFVKRNIKTRSHNIKTKTYKALVRHRLEYCASVWDPHTQSAIQKMEMVQRRAARYVLKRYHNTSSVSDMLAQRRCCLRLTMLYKIKNSIVTIDPTPYLKPIRITTRTNSLSFLPYR